MCTPLYLRVLPLFLGAAWIGCGTGLTLPDDRSPAALSAISGSGQEGTVGSRLDDPLVVRVTDASSRPVAGVPIEFRFKTEAPEGEVAPTQVATDIEGYASAEVRLGVTAGSQIVEALVAQNATSDLRATFDLTAVTSGNGKKGKRGKGGGRNGGDGDDDDDDDDDDD